MIQLNRLEGFYWVGRTGGYASAARAFPYPITQPGVYQQVRKLEEDIGRKLFERVGRGDMRLTPAGQLLFDYVAPFYERLPAAVRAIQADEYGGTLRVYAAGKVIESILPAWLARMNAERPDIEVEVFEADSADGDQIRRGECDVLIDHFPGGVPKDLDADVVGELSAFVILPKDHPQASSETLDFTQLAHAPFVAYHRNFPQYALQREALERLGITPRVVAHLGTASKIAAMVGAGLGISFVPALAADSTRWPGVTARRLELSDAHFLVHAAYRADGPVNPLVDVFISYFE